MRFAPLLLFVSLAGTFAQSPAIQNFGEVAPGMLYRGSQPDGRGMLDLKDYGIRTVLDLRTGNRSAEKAAVEALGMKYLNWPLNGVLAPSTGQIEYVLNLIDVAEKPIFLHCQHGQDRTGTVVACYRMSRDHWTNERAFSEAVFFHINPLQVFMRQFIHTWRP